MKTCIEFKLMKLHFGLCLVAAEVLTLLRIRWDNNRKSKQYWDSSVININLNGGAESINLDVLSNFDRV